MTDFQLVLFFLLLFAHSIFIWITAYNLLKAPRIKKINRLTGSNFFISILIPVRNEENNIKSLLDSIGALSYQNYEVLVLDDGSEDESSRIIDTCAEENNKITGLSGKELPDGWKGKNWACSQLAERAKGDWLLFIDADVTLAPDSLSIALGLISRNNLNMLSCFPTQKLRSTGEWFIVPLMNWLLLTFLPMNKVLTSKNKNVTAANGQFILINKQTYYEIGGHNLVKDAIVEDMELARLIKDRGDRLMTTVGDKEVYCKMYTSFREAFSGFSKNFYPGFNVSRSVFLGIIILFLFLFLVPLGLSFVNPTFIFIPVLIFFERLFVSVVSRQNWLLNTLLHPFQMLMMFWIGIHSLFSREKFWKGRKIS